MTPDKFKDLAIETQKEFELFCNRRKCEECTIRKILKDNSCLYIDCETFFSVCKLLNDFNIDLLKKIDNLYTSYCNEHDCNPYKCELKKYQEENTFLFDREGLEDTEEEEYEIDCSLMYTIAYLNDCLDIIIKEEDN